MKSPIFLPLACRIVVQDQDVKRIEGDLESFYEDDYYSMNYISIKKNFQTFKIHHHHDHHSTDIKSGGGHHKHAGNQLYNEIVNTKRKSFILAHKNEYTNTSIPQ
jgi:hypothetical protein